jgi:deoxyribodipyrimidine photo-lyase
MQAVGVDSSTKLSPFLALGCVSPRQVDAAVRQLQLEQLHLEQREQGQQQHERKQQQGRQVMEQQTANADVTAAKTQAAKARAGGRSREAGSSSGVVSEACKWLAMHLVIRDFFIFTALKAGDTLVTTGTAAFQQGAGSSSGIDGGKREGKGGGKSKGGVGGDGSTVPSISGQWREDPEAFQAWASGRTGFPFVDAVGGCLGGIERALAEAGFSAM